MSNPDCFLFIKGLLGLWSSCACVHTCVAGWETTVWETALGWSLGWRMSVDISTCERKWWTRNWTQESLYYKADLAKDHPAQDSGANTVHQGCSAVRGNGSALTRLPSSVKRCWLPWKDVTSTEVVLCCWGPFEVGGGWTLFADHLPRSGP